MAIEIEGITPLIFVFDMPESVHFYRDVLGFELVNHAPEYAEGLFHWAMLQSNGVTFMLNTAYDEGKAPEKPVPARVHAHGDTQFYLGCADLDAAYRHVLANGIKVKPPTVARYGFKQLHLKDPDGYHLCLQQPI
ncbi:MAG TPA: VOC family protein [Terracidiphilus sp.]|nr:VOC family protein [Terracidiphilus sp.]